MKKNLDFNLTGKQFFPVWLLFLLIVVMPYTLIVLKLGSAQKGQAPNPLTFLVLLFILIAAFVFSFFIAKMTIENIVYNNRKTTFTGSFDGYFGKVILGLFLSIITLGIYIPWFIRNLARFFVNNTSNDSTSFRFQGNGGKLFLILLLTMFLPLTIFIGINVSFALKNPGAPPHTGMLTQLIMMFVLIPYIYFLYKWMVNINYKNYNIRWETNFWKSVGKIALEMALTVITFGIYFPLALLRLYKYFTERTYIFEQGIQPEKKGRMNYELEPLKDFLFIWKQTLLSIITAGVYYSWAYCKIQQRILSKTSIE
jgi:uncharacterized membrane protein YjgN (DUF898 family)